MTLAELPFLDFQDPAFNLQSPAFREARDATWIVRTNFGYGVLRYEDCAALLRDRRLHQGSKMILALRGITEGPLLDWWEETMLNLDGDAHTRLRRLVARAFTPPMVERLRPYFRATAERLVAAFPADGRVEFVSAFSEPYPLAGICELVGIPHARRAAFEGWAADLALIFSEDIGSAVTRERAEAALAGMYSCAADAIAARRAEPDDDLVGQLIAADETGDRLSQSELERMIVGLVFAGNDTTRNQLAYGLLALANRPEQWAAIVRDPEAAPRAVDEMMRLVPSISVVPRVVAEDFTYKGVEFRRGQVLQLLTAAANVDDRVFENRGFDVTTELPSPHLTFSGGIHRCLGMWLAKAEMAVALQVLTAHFGTVELAGEPTWTPGLGIRGPSALPLRFAR